MSDTAFSMSLWDLGYNAYASINALPVAYIVLQHAVAGFKFQPIHDGLGIRVFIVSIAPLFTLLKVMEIYRRTHGDHSTMGLGTVANSRYFELVFNRYEQGS
jgi:hypothetical protein